MTTLALLDDCVRRARQVPALLDGMAPPEEALERCDALIADLDAALDQCLDAVRAGEDLAFVVSQILQLKWLVYSALGKHLTACGWSHTALAAFTWSARCDLRDSRARHEAAEHARFQHELALAG